jgi:hypothetical protein
MVKNYHRFQIDDFFEFVYTCLFVFMTYTNQYVINQIIISKTW